MSFNKFELNKNKQYSKLELVQHYILFSYHCCFKEKKYICGDDFYKFFDFLDSNLFIYLENNFDEIQKDINTIFLKEKIKYKKEYIVNEFNRKLESVQIGEFIQESVLYNYNVKYNQSIDNDLHSHISFFIESYSNDIENKTIQTGGGLDKIINADITQNGYLLEFKKDLGCFETEISSNSKNLIFNINCNHVFFNLLLTEIKRNYPHILDTESYKKHLNILVSHFNKKLKDKISNKMNIIKFLYFNINEDFLYKIITSKRHYIITSVVINNIKQYLLQDYFDYFLFNVINTRPKINTLLSFNNYYDLNHNIKLQINRNIDFKTYLYYLFNFYYINDDAASRSGLTLIGNNGELLSKYTEKIFQSKTNLRTKSQSKILSQNI